MKSRKKHDPGCQIILPASPNGKSAKKLRFKFKRHTNKHHVYPTSRFILKKNPIIHTAWHDVFGNSAPEEAVEKVKDWITKPEEFEKKIFENERKTKAWEILFGGLNTSLTKVLEIIKRDWTYPGIKMIKIDSNKKGLAN